MLNPEDYVVGWICALSTEYVAARAFLDENHGTPDSVASNDNNNYTLGKMREHNVVIAVLPDGEYGTSTAASVARDMLHSFPNIRIGLMVGIGGGAPSSKYDIRLGDIVVSAPRGGNGGVVQYDFGKMIQGQGFQVTGFLNQPPMVLRTAMNGLKAQYESDGHALEEAIDSVLKEKPRLRKKYKRPEPGSDRLHQSGVTHPLNNESPCAVTCNDDPSNLILRPGRTEDEDNPAIHYGLIASANRLMMDASARDRLAAEKDILCFEMEAAGLINHFPCLVIRGICDYSDSHKGYEWQGYAAMVAAAYAKDLLYQIAPSRVETERKIGDILASVKRGINEVCVTAQDTNVAVKSLRIDHRQEKIKQWLSPSDPSTNYNKALRQRHEGTGSWFLKSDMVAKWKTKQNSFLWLHGIPGCGKTILSSTIIEDLEKNLPSQCVLYFYFDFSDTDKQTLESMARSLVFQLYSKCGPVPEELEYLFSSCEDGRRQPTCESLYKVLWHLIEQGKELWLILDGLDECRTRGGSLTEGILSWIGHVRKSEQNNVHLLVTSRPEHDIQTKITEFAHIEEIFPVQTSAITDDIRAYVRARVREDSGLKRWRSRPEVQEEIETRLLEKVDGMFRWAACQLDALGNCLDYRALQNALASLPKTLDETYLRILRRIPEQCKQNAIRVLQFLTYSKRPMRIEEIVDAIAVDTQGKPHFDPGYRMPDPHEISLYYSSLVVVMPVKKYRSEGYYEEHVELRLAHFSVKEYLSSNRLEKDIAPMFQEINAQASIATVCLAYLRHLDSDLPNKEIKKRFPLAKYCADHWMSHAAVAESTDAALRDLIIEFFCHHKSSYRNCYRLHGLDRSSYRTENKEWNEPAIELYYAASGGLECMVNYLLSQGMDANAEIGLYTTALCIASGRGHEKIVALLLSNGADINATHELTGTALCAASAHGHERIVALLLSNGADVNKLDAWHSSALHEASRSGHEKIVALLLSNGADVNATHELTGTALCAASAHGHEKIVALLLSNGADIDRRSRFSATALYAASERGDEGIVRVLLAEGANVNIHQCTVRQYLMAEGANGNIHEHTASLTPHTALAAAAKCGHISVVKLLLDYGAEIDAKNYEGKTALYLAAPHAQPTLIQLLLERGANPSMVDEKEMRRHFRGDGSEEAIMLIKRWKNQRMAAESEA